MKNLFFLLIFSFLLLSFNSIPAQNFENYSQKIEDKNFEIELVAIQGGSFLMGTEDPKRNMDEKPLHKVVVDDFWMGKYEINWQQYDAFVFTEILDDNFLSENELKKLGIDAVSAATAPYVDMSFGMGKENSPAVNMTQYAALMYCKWLTAKTGVFYRLPTEAEWEFVCKQGRTDQVTDLQNVGWFEKNSNKKYQKTGLKTPNKFGIYDMLGNVSEWVLDQYEEDYYKNSPKNNPWNKPDQLYPRVVRGGSWKDTADKLCCTSRQRSNANWKRRDPQIPKSNWWHTNAPFVGFRVVRPKKQPSKEEIEQYWLKAIEDYGIN